MRRPSRKTLVTAGMGLTLLGIAGSGAYALSRIGDDGPNYLWPNNEAPAGHYLTLEEYPWKTEAQVFVAPTGKTIERTIYSNERPYTADTNMLCWEGIAAEVLNGIATPLAPGSCIERVIADSYQGGVAQYASEIPKLKITDTQQN